MTQIKQSSFSRFTNDESNAFHMSVLNMAKALNMTEIRPALEQYEKSFNAFNGALNKDKQGVLVKNAKKADDERDDAWRGANTYIKCAAKYHPMASAKAAAQDLLDVFDDKGNPTGLAYTIETSVLDKLIDELEKMPGEIEAAQFGIWFDQLKTKHQAYLLASEDKTDAKSSKVAGAVKNTRIQCETDYLNLITLINAFATILKSEELDKFAAKVNVLLDDQKTFAKTRATKEEKDKAKEAEKAVAE